MFEELTPYEKYIIFIHDLKDQFLFANGAYKRGYFEIEFNNTEHIQYYLDNIATYRRRLENTLDIVKMSKADVDLNSLGKSEKKLFNSDEDLFNKVLELLDRMNNFLSQHGVEMSI